MDVPVRQLTNERIADDTYVVRQLFGEGLAPDVLFSNSMVITGAEPIIVDTGPHIIGDQWLEAAFSIVEPQDVRWIYLSHDDHDHVGNLNEVLDDARRADRALARAPGGVAEPSASTASRSAGARARAGGDVVGARDCVTRHASRRPASTRMARNASPARRAASAGGSRASSSE